MQKRWQIWISIALVLGIVGSIAWYWLLVESGQSTQHYAIDMEAVRELAQSIPGDKALTVRVEDVASATSPAFVGVAGDNFTPTNMDFFAYQLVFPQSSMLIDTGLTHAQADAGGMSMTRFDDGAEARVVSAMHKANLIVVTHEHFDHIGSLAADAQLAKLLSVARLTKEQLQDPKKMAPAKIAPEVLAHYTPLQYDRYYAIAPGVVLIKAPGHTPGSQMVYVHANTGQEYLFTGDVAWHRRNITLERERARLVTWLFLGEDRDAVLAQLTELHRLTVDEPQLRIVPGHDKQVVEGLESQQLMEKGFQ